MMCRNTMLVLIHSISLAAATTESQLVADINPGPAGSFPEELATFGGSLYFSAYTLNTGRELWKLSGSNVTLVADINDTRDDIGFGVMEGNDSNPGWFTEFNGELYFSAFDPRRGGELWKLSNGQPVRVADISPDSNDSLKPIPNSSWPSELTVFNGALYFSANGGTTRENYELWRFDGASARQVANIHPDTATNQSSYPKELTVFKDGLYFSADDGTNGWELWKHDAAVEATLLNVSPGGATSSSYPKELTVLGDHLYFQAHHPEHGVELWRTDGTNTTLATELRPTFESSFPEFLTVFDGQIYFRAMDVAHGYELFRHDGNQASLAADINPAGDSFPKNLAVFGNFLVFAATDGVNGYELWKFDGTTATMVTNLNAVGDSFPEHFHVLNNTLYFAATTPETGYEVWSYDGTTVRLASDVVPGSGSSFPRELRSYNGQLYFSAAGDGANNWELWTIRPAVTEPVAEAANIGSVVRNGQTISISATGTAGAAYTLQATTDFRNWSNVATSTASPAGALSFSDTIISNYRFYRIVVATQ